MGAVLIRWRQRGREEEVLSGQLASVSRPPTLAARRARPSRLGREEELSKRKERREKAKEQKQQPLLVPGRRAKEGEA